MLSADGKNITTFLACGSFVPARALAGEAFSIQSGYENCSSLAFRPLDLLEPGPELVGV